MVAAVARLLQAPCSGPQGIYSAQSNSSYITIDPHQHESDVVGHFCDVDPTADAAPPRRMKPETFVFVQRKMNKEREKNAAVAQWHVKTCTSYPHRRTIYLFFPLNIARS